MERWSDGCVNATATILLPVILPATAVLADGEPGFDPKYERDDNIFNPVNQYRPDNPLNSTERFDPNNPFNPVNRFDPTNPCNPTNRAAEAWGF